MATINEIAAAGELSQAVYSNLVALGSISAEWLLNEANGDRNMSPAQANDIASRYTVEAVANDPTTGAYAAVFKDKQTGQVIVAVRGTDEASDWLSDAFLLTGIPPSLNPQFNALRPVIAQWVQSGVIPAGSIIAGHSLGGYLAAALKATLPAVLADAYTFNAPGFVESLGGLPLLLQTIFGMPVAQAGVWDVRGSAGLSVIARLGNHLGSLITVEIESAGVAGLDNHAIARLTQSLAVLEMWSELDPTLTLTRGNQLLWIASNTASNGHEKSVESFLRLVGGPAASSIATNDAEQLYGQLLSLTARAPSGSYTHPAFAMLAGKVSVSISSANLSARARSDFSAMAGLLALSPITLNGTDAANQALLDSTLGAAWGQSYTDWLADKDLSVAERASGKGATSDSWIVDRTAMLVAINAKNMRDEPYPTTSYGDGLKPTTRYVDLASGITLNSGDPTSTQLAQIVFGSDTGDTRSGGSRADRLYGGNGNDDLSGAEGDDRLEGQNGDDTLSGGAGVDRLLGGAGNDTLSGGADNDILLGGAGDDIYRFVDGWGHDTVKDSDGLGSLSVAGYEFGLPQGKKVATGTYRSADGAVTYTVDGTRLLITFADRSDTITLEQWSPATNLGITFDETLTLPETWASLSGTEEADVLHYPNLADSETLLGLGGDDTLGSSTITYNTSGQLPDSLFEVQHDVMDGGSGNDLIFGGDGEDTIFGAGGSDEIFGGIHAEGYFWTYFGLDESNPQPWVDVNFSAGRRALDSNTIDAGDGDDAVTSGWGDDVVHAGLGADNVIGQAGADVLWGDEGNDVLWGDGAAKYEWDQAWWNQIWADAGLPANHIVISYELGNLSCDQAYTPAYLHGDDVLLGGLGDDRLVGMGGADELDGGDGDDRLYGDTYFDDLRTIQLSTAPLDVRGNDRLDGGAGADHLIGDAGDDSLYGGAGNDKLWGDFDNEDNLSASYHGEDYLDGGEGDDQLTGGGADDVMIGGDGADAMLGDDKQGKVPVSAHGRDVMDGGDGNDLMVGGGGSDEMYGDAGDDQMLGDDLDVAVDASAHGDDLMDGGAGNDHLRGGGSSDSLFGGAGNDVLRGDDVLAALVPTAHGDDWLAGDAGTDTLYGDGGGDTLVGGSDTDYLSGGEGSDTYLYGIGHGSDVIDNDAADGASALDSLQLDGIAADGVSVSRFREDLIVRVNGGDTVTVLNHFASVEQELDRIAFADGTSWDQQQIIARLSAGVGTDGDDRLGGTATGDVIDGGAGDDQIIGGAGADLLTGGAGSDTYFFDVGFGSDTVDEAGTDAADDSNWIVLGAGLHGGNVMLSNILTSVQQYDLEIDVLAPDLTFTGDRIVVTGFFEQANATSSIDGIRFDNGLEWSAEWIHQHFYAEPGSRPGNVFSGMYTDDTLTGLDADETILGLAGNDTILGNGGADSLYGDNGNDLLDGGSGDDRLYGGAGSDVLGGGGGNDSLTGGAGDDVYRFGRGGGQDSVDELLPTIGDADVIRFDADIAPGEIEVVHAVIDGATYLDHVLLRIAGTADSIKTYGWWQGADLISRVEFADGTVWTAADVARRLPTTGTGESAAVYGSAFDDVIRGNAGDDDLWGGRGGDIYAFGAGDGYDVVTEIVDGSQNVIRFDAGVSAADVVVTRNETSVMLAYGAGDLIRIADWSPSSSARIQRVEFADGTVWLAADVLARVGIGSARDDDLHGSTLDDSLWGMAGNDSLTGQEGNDLLDGGTGNDWLNGGAGDDIYLRRAADGSDTIENADASDSSVDTLRFDASAAPELLRVMRNPSDLLIDLPGAADQILLPNAFVDAAAQIDRVEFTDGTVWSWADLLARIAGPSEDWDWLVGSDGADVMHGLGGADWMYGLAGDDAISGGADRDYLIGGEGADRLAGDDGDDGLQGGQGADSLTGGAGNDALGGGGGIDTYIFAPGFGHDNVIDFLEDDGSANVLHFGGVTPSQIIVSRTDSALYLVADGASDHVIIDEWFDAEELHAFDLRFDDGTVWRAGSLESRIDGAHATAGDDVLYGTAGNDVIAGAAGNDIASGGGGNDLVRGGDGNDTLFGSSGNAVLEGGGGDDALVSPTLGTGLLIGGNGDDDVEVWSGGNQVVAFNVGDGNDTLGLAGAGAGVVLSIGGGAQLADIWLRRDAGSAEPVIGIGSSGSIRLQGYPGDAAPALVLQVVEPSGVRLFDLSAVIAEFMNLPSSSPDIEHWAAQNALASNQIDSNPTLAYGGQLAYQYGLNGSLAAVSDAEAQRLLSDPQFGSVAQSVLPDAILGTSGDDVLTGTTAADLLMGYAGNDALDGGPGADRMVGGSGDDTYLIDDAGDTVIENVAEGLDLVLSAITTTLADNIENITLTGVSAVNATGNALDNVLTGNEAVNALAGGAGNDTYAVGAGDAVVEAAGEGIDTVLSPVSWSLGAHIERLVLTGTGAVNGAGNALANHIQGNSADNTLNGGGGADRLSGGAGNDNLIGGMGSDTMAGGSGDDTFVVDVSTDVVVELAGEGIDTVMSSVTLRLGDNVENLTLTGSNAINAGGNALHNVLTGNSASNQMAGGAGNDSYVVGSGDTVTEALGAGIDTVWSSVTWTLGNNLENLTLTGNAAINGAGNALDNVLIGNSAANTLRGAAGSDIYDGRGGNDVLTDLSTTSGDVYRWGIGSGTDTVTDSGGRDRVDIGAGITESQLTFARNGSNLELTVAGRTDKLIVSNWYLSAANQVEEFRLSDGNSVFASEIQSLVSAMAVFDVAQQTAVDVGRETILPLQQPDPLWSVPAVM